MADLPPTTNLPRKWFELVGQAIVLWAEIEASLIELVYEVALRDKKRARIVFRKIDTGKFIDVIQKLLSLDSKRIGLPPARLTKMQAEFERAGLERDYLAHGVWILHPRAKRPVLRVTKGPTENKSRGRLIDPDGLIVTTKSLIGQVKHLQRVRKMVETLHRAALQAPGKSPKYKRTSWTLTPHRRPGRARRAIGR